MSEITEEVFFWEHPEARSRLLALQSPVSPVDADSASDSESDSCPVTVKRLDQDSRNTTKSNFLQEELYSRRIRTREWKIKYDRLDASGVGNHRC